MRFRTITIEIDTLLSDRGAMSVCSRCYQVFLDTWKALRYVQINFLTTVVASVLLFKIYGGSRFKITLKTLEEVVLGAAVMQKEAILEDDNCHLMSVTCFQAQQNP